MTPEERIERAKKASAAAVAARRKRAATAKKPGSATKAKDQGRLKCNSSTAGVQQFSFA
jgi:hypothetical protein